MSDFHLIVIDEQKLNVKSFNQLHKKSLNFIKSKINKNKELKKVIVTHYLPSEKCNHHDFIGSKLNSAFSVDLTDFIEKSKIDM